MPLRARWVVGCRVRCPCAATGSWSFISVPGVLLVIVVHNTPPGVSYGHGAPTRCGLTCAVPGGRMWSAECGVRSDCEVALATSYSKF